MKKTILKSNKILGLEQLSNLGFKVPKFDFIKDFTEFNLQNTDINAQYPPKILKDEITKKIKKFNIDNGISIRSASFDEDNSNQSSAGRYLSFNGLTSIDEIVEAAILIWKHHRNNSHNTKCPLIIQETHPSFYSGVAFKDGETIIIESYYGACSNIVDGVIKPYTTTFQNGKRIDNYNINNNYSYLFNAHTNIFKNKNFSCGKLLKPKTLNYTLNNHIYNFVNSKILKVYGNRPDFPITHYDDKIIPQLLNILSELDNKEGVDIEWGTDIYGNVYLYQFRKLTRSISNIQMPAIEDIQNKDGVLYGMPVSAGKAIGVVTDRATDSAQNTILFTKYDNVNDINDLKNVKGVIALNGGILSHLSIICREMNIPCIVNINEQIPVGKTVELDGNTGLIKILD